MMKKTLGGERLGSGNKMQVELHGYSRSTHDLGYLWRSTMSAGTLVPFMKLVALPGDTFDIDLNCDIKTHPTIGPLFGSHKVQLDVFLAPIRLYQGLLHNNKLGIGLNMANVKLPVLEISPIKFDIDDVPDLDNSQCNPSCILSYLGIRGVATADLGGAAGERQFNAVPFIAYWDIYKNYYANKQEEIGAVIHNPGSAITNTPDEVRTYITSVIGAGVIIAEQSTPTGTQGVLSPTGRIEIDYTGPIPQLGQIMLNLSDGRRLSVEALQGGPADTTTAGLIKVPYNAAVYGIVYVDTWQIVQPWEIQVQQPIVQTFPLSNIDLMRERILQDTAVASQLVVNDVVDGAANPLMPYNYVLGATSGYPARLWSQEGLALKTYQSDLFNNWLQTEWIDGVGGINDITAIDTTGGSFNIDTLVLSKKVYDMLNRIAVSGGTYDDWIDAVYTHDRFKRAETPMYMGGLIKELVFQEVVSNSASNGENQTQPLGTLAGKGVMSNKHKGGKVVIKVDEPSYVLGIISITPRLDYSQGNDWDVHLSTLDDLHKPALDEIGFQELITEQMAWWSTNQDPVTGDFVTKSAGKQPAWINYMTGYNKALGNFAIATNEMFMTLNRRYENTGLTTATQEIRDLTTYIDPVKFNHIFAQTALDAQNYWAQISVDITARRKMSAKVMPNL